MRQRVTTKAIIEQDGKIMLLRRKGGRRSIDGLYELPGGRIHKDQQPKDAMQHALRIHIGSKAETIKLYDLMSFADPDDRDLQYLFIIYKVKLAPHARQIKLSGDYDKYVWRSTKNLNANKLTEATKQQLGVTPIPYVANVARAKDSVDSSTTYSKLIMFTDGGSRGNPGPAAAGYVALSTDREVLFEGGDALGIATNNVAEYTAVILALQAALDYGAKTVDMRMDSQLVTRQLSGQYKVKHQDLLPLHRRIIELTNQFDQVSFTHVVRSQNTLADGVVNKILDSHK